MIATNKQDILDGNVKQIPKRDQLVAWVRQWGGSTSDAILEPAVKIFSIPKIMGFIGYRLIYDCAIVFGDPLCAPTDVAILTNAFHQFMDKQSIRIIYLIVSQSFAKWAINTVCGALLEFGQELTLNPMNDPSKMSGEFGRLVRKKIKHAAREGIIVYEYIQEDAKLEQSIEEISKKWLNKRTGHQFHICNISLFNDRAGKRWFYAKNQDKIMGIVILNQFKAKNGWFLNNLMVIPDAPNGTSEILVISALETLAKENCTFVTFGMVTNPEFGEIMGLNKISAWIVRMALKLAYKVGHLEGQNIFWSKFNPQREPGYILFSRKTFGIRELMAIKNVSYEGKYK